MCEEDKKQYMCFFQTARYLQKQNTSTYLYESFLQTAPVEQLDTEGEIKRKRECAVLQSSCKQGTGKNVQFKPYYETLLSENLGAHCRE